MRKFLFLLSLPLLSFFALTACDDSSGNSKAAVSPELSTLEVGPVRYDTTRHAFVVQATITVKDVQDKPLSGITVYLSSSSENVAMDEAQKITDVEGKSVFELISHHIEDVEITAFYVKAGKNDAAVPIQLAEPVSVHFGATLTLELSGTPVYTAQQGTFPLRLHLTDEAGDVAGAELVWQAMDNGLEVTPGEMVTNDQGVVELSAVTARADQYRLDFELAGIEEFLSAEVALLGPAIGGTIAIGMSFPEITHPRVGVFGINVIDEPPSIFGEFPGSVAVDMSQEEASFTVHLPIVPPMEWLREANAGVYAGYFPPALYNDTNENGVWDPDEYIIAAHGTPGVFLYLPADPASPHAGWRFFEELGGRPQPMPWEDASMAQDMLVTSAPVRVPQVTGAAQTPLTNVRVALYVVDAPLFLQMAEEGGNPWTLIFDPAHAAPMMDVPAMGDVYSGSIDDPLEVLDEAQLAAWSITTPIRAGFELTQLVALPFTYVDADDNGSLSQGDMPATTLDPPYGVEWQLTYVLDLPRIGGFFSTGALWLHAGWNWIASPKEYEISQVVVNMPGFPTLEVDEDVPAGLTGIHFEVLDATTGNVDASGTFASGGSSRYINITDCLDCQNIQVGDTLRVTEVISETTFIDWGQDLNFGTIYGP